MWNLYRYLRFLNLLFSRIPVPLCLFITPNSTVLLDRYILVYTLHIVQRSKQRDSGKANSILTSYFKLFNSKAGHDQIYTKGSSHIRTEVSARRPVPICSRCSTRPFLSAN